MVSCSGQEAAPMKPMRALLLGFGLVSLTTVVPAHPAAAEPASQDVAYGTGSVLTTLVYAPVKASVCILGGITSGFTLPFAGPRTAEHVVTRACGGTWAITPDALRGKERVRFLGGGSGSSRVAR
jgi:hypothetical protein